ncbi:GcrA family cell cycle regulator [Belnapia rosea]|uniref:GcrA cell cycle regulator n=1 Tax=Belnapia rosea TaxID=938405 RepID=A0A1G6NK45_9PROT|nr:GcrA family cell cycle regulator [Belnapia rosea]SDC68079.1 GcrA cell cycle regulator [Belnapia rosea]
MEWTAEAIDQLRAYWAEGHSTAEIGRRMGISKNAVVGKAHRLNLDARPSPIRREAEAGERPAAQPRRSSSPARDGASLRRLEQPAQPSAGTVVRAFPRASARTCCWPLGEPGTPEFRFCSGDAMTGKPYCQEHASVAYVKARDRREDAA